MSDYIGRTRTNYFSVTDTKKFKKIVDQIFSDNPIILFEENNRYGFGCYGSIHGFKPEQEDDEPDFDHMCEELQSILVDGDAIIMMEVGHEGLRYVSAVGVIITKSQVITRSLDDHLIKEVRQILDDDSFITRISY